MCLFSHGRNQASSVRLRIDVVRVAWYGAPMTRLVLYAGFFVRVSEHLAVLMYLGVCKQGRSTVSRTEEVSGLVFTQRTRWSVALSCHARPWQISSIQ